MPTFANQIDEDNYFDRLAEVDAEKRSGECKY